MAELSVLPGETLTKLARALERHELAPGDELDTGEQFAIVLSGLLSGPTGVLHPGDHASGRVRAMTPSAVASCDRSTYEEIAGGDS